MLNLDPHLYVDPAVLPRERNGFSRGPGNCSVPRAK